MEQHAVPQHIASFEFKLFGPLTIRQFITLAIPMSVAVLIFFSPLPSIPRIAISAIIGALAVLAALVPFQGRPIDKWIVAFIKSITSPTQRIWIKESKIPSFLSIVTAPPTTKKSANQTVTTLGKERLRAYLRSLPSSQSTPLDEREQIALKRLNIDYKSEGEGKLPPAIVWQTEIQAVKPEEVTFAPNSLPQINQDAAGATPTKTMAAPKISHSAKKYALPGLEKKLRQDEIPHEQIDIAPHIKTRLASEDNFTEDNIIPIQTSGNQIRLIRGVGKTRVRKLHYAPPDGFNLSKLPIRGESRFEISEELKKRFEPPKLQRSTQDAGIEMEQKVEPIIPQEIQIHKTPKPKSTSKPQATTSQDQFIPLTDTPNVISGLVVDKNNTPLENIIMVIKDSKGIPVRALKTNKLGQFLSATPLTNGNYVVELESDFQTFKPHSLSLEGKILEPLKIVSEGAKN